LREEVARLAEVLEVAEIEQDRRVIAREELVQALAVSAAASTAVTTLESLAPGGARVAPPGDVGGIQCRPAAGGRRPVACGRAGRRLIRATIDPRIIAALVASRVS
jgi:hypothetical protein